MLKTAVTATALHAQLDAIDLAKVPVMSTDRSIARKVQAKLARNLLKQLGIRGISVTTPNYSMAQSVDVSFPRRDDYTRDEHGQINFLTDPAAVANTAASQKLEAILNVAFPNHVDRSDSQSDHFDYKWSIN